MNYTEDDDKKEIEEDIVLDLKNFIESLYYSEDIVELDVIENFKDFVSFCTGSIYITHKLMRAGTIIFRHFEQNSSPGVRVVLNTCNITLTFPANGRYNTEPEQFLKNIFDNKTYESMI